MFGSFECTTIPDQRSLRWALNKATAPAEDSGAYLRDLGASLCSVAIGYDRLPGMDV